MFKYKNTFLIVRHAILMNSVAKKKLFKNKMILYIFVCGLNRIALLIDFCEIRA